VVLGLNYAQQGVPETPAYDRSRTTTFQDVIKSRAWFSHFQALQKVVLTKKSIYWGAVAGGRTSNDATYTRNLTKTTSNIAFSLFTGGIGEDITGRTEFNQLAEIHIGRII